MCRSGTVVISENLSKSPTYSNSQKSQFHSISRKHQNWSDCNSVHSAVVYPFNLKLKASTSQPTHFQEIFRKSSHHRNTKAVLSSNLVMMSRVVDLKRFWFNRICAYSCNNNVDTVFISTTVLNFDPRWFVLLQNAPDCRTFYSFNIFHNFLLFSSKF